MVATLTKCLEMNVLRMKACIIEAVTSLANCLHNRNGWLLAIHPIHPYGSPWIHRPPRSPLFLTFCAVRMRCSYQYRKKQIVFIAVCAFLK